MPLPGTRENPVRLISPRDLERATRHVRRPSPGQAEAGNYQKAHVLVGHDNAGWLPIAIENPLDSFRRGTDPNGEEWEVRMPADYGYAKRTEAVDGDKVDIYLGPHAHVAHRLPVWVIDQQDAETREYDEPKCMVGFRRVEDARKTYHAAFSDGKGPDRVGGVARMTFKEFRQWLRSDAVRRPLVMKSACEPPLGGGYVAFACPRGINAGEVLMTQNAIAGNGAPTAKGLGAITGLFAKVMGRLSPDERTALLQDATALGLTELGKASDLLDQGDDRGRIGQVEDQWDGPPDDRAPIVSAHGPDSKVRSGETPVGPTQSASGDGAAKMERQYSRPAPQGGVQSATEMLGREVAGMRGAMKSLVRVFEAQNAKIDLIKSTADAALTAEGVQNLIDMAVAKALGSLDKTIAKTARLEVARIIVAKADSEKESTSGHETEEEDEEAEQEESGGGGDDVEIEITNETEDEAESDEDKDSAKSAALLLHKAKIRAKWASRRLAKAEDMAEEDKKKAAERNLKMARHDASKAIAYVETAKGLLNGRLGPIAKSIVAKAKKAMDGVGEAQAENQKKWPASTESEVGKSAPVATAPAAAPPTAASSPDLAKAAEQIAKAAQGMGMMTANVRELLDAVTSQRRVTDPTTGANLPPVFALAKAGGDAVSAAEQRLATLRDQNVISFDEHEKARDALTRAQMGLPEQLIAAEVARLPKAAQEALSLPQAA